MVIKGETDNILNVRFEFGRSEKIFHSRHSKENKEDKERAPWIRSVIVLVSLSLICQPRFDSPDLLKKQNTED